MGQLQSYPNRGEVNGQMEFIVDDPTINQTVNLTFETLRNGIVTTTAIADVATLQELLDGKLSLEGGVMSGQITFASGQTFPEDPNATMIDTTFGSELVEQGPNSIAAVTRNTTQTISGGKTFTGTVDLSNSTLIGVELGADVTTRARIYAQLGISSAGRSNFVLNEQGVFVQLPDSAGNVTQLVNEITTQQTAMPAGGGVAQFSVTGVASTIVNISIVNANPANWITDSAIDSTQVTLDDAGNGTVNITVPTYTLTDTTRSFQVRAQVEGAFQAAVTSEVVTQYTANNLLTSISLSALAFGNAGVTEAINVSGVANTQYTLELFQVTPAGWIASGALSATQGVLDGNGMDSSITIMIPSAQDDTVNRSFRLRARVVGDLTQVAESPSISQVHTQSTAAGNLIVGADAIYSTPNIDFYTNITQGDAPFEIVLNNHPTDKTVNPLHTLNLTELHETFDAGNSSDNPFTGPLAGGFVDYKWTLRYDPDEDDLTFQVSSLFLEENFAADDTSVLSVDSVIVRVPGVPPFLAEIRQLLDFDFIVFQAQATDLTSFSLDESLYSESQIASGNETVYYGNSTGVIQIEKTTNFQINVGSGEYSFTTDNTEPFPLALYLNDTWIFDSSTGDLSIRNRSYFPSDGNQITVSFGGNSETVTFSPGVGSGLTLTDSSLISAIQASGTLKSGTFYSGTSTISFVANPGAPAPPVDGSTDYYLHVSDNDGDIVVAMETIIIDNMTPSGMIEQTTGSIFPADENDVALTATFTDAESNPFNYQWQLGTAIATFGNDILDIPNAFSADTGSGAISTWSGSNDLSAAVGFAVTENSLQGFTIAAGFAGERDTVISNTADSITTTSNVIASQLVWAGARIYDNTYTNITGETDSVLGFEWRDFAALDQEEITVGAVFAPNNSTLASYNYTGSSIISSATFAQVGNDAVSFVYDDDANTVVLDYGVDVSVSMGVIPSDFTFTFNIAGGGTQTVSPSTLPGLYRCQVTAVNGDTTPVNSNAIELT